MSLLRLRILERQFLYARLVGTYYGMALASVCLSVRLSVRLSTKLVDTIQTEPFQLGRSNLVHRLLMTRGRTLLIFKVMGQRSRSQATGHGSKVKVTGYTLLLNLVYTIQTEPFQLGPSNLVHRLLMTRGRHLLAFKVMGQRSRSHATHCC